jgi:hypothetical protein
MSDSGTGNSKRGMGVLHYKRPHKSTAFTEAGKQSLGWSKGKNDFSLQACSLRRSAATTGHFYRGKPITSRDVCQLAWKM